MAARFAAELPADEPPPLKTRPVGRPAREPGWAEIEAKWTAHADAKPRAPDRRRNRPRRQTEQIAPGWRPTLWEGAVVNEKLLWKIRMRRRAAAGWGRESKGKQPPGGREV